MKVVNLVHTAPDLWSGPIGFHDMQGEEQPSRTANPSGADRRGRNREHAAPPAKTNPASRSCTPAMMAVT